MSTRGADDLDVRVAIQRLREPVALHRNRPRSLTLGASIQKMASIIRHGAPFVPDCIMGLEMQNNAAEIKLRAERRAGEMLDGSLPHKGGRPKRKRSHHVTVSPVQLKEIGVTKMQSSRWQSIATLPKEDFEGYIRLRRD